MVLSIVSGALSVAILVFCLIVATKNNNVYGVVTSSIYGASLIILYSISSVYHGLRKYIPKKVFQILNHCAIFMLIAGTYTVILLSSIKQVNPVIAWTFFGIEWGVAAFAITFTSVDLEKHKMLSVICYIIMGWAILPIFKIAIAAMGLEGFVLLMTGIALYTIALIVYMLEKRMKYLHSVFHIVFLIGSVVQFLSIILYCL
jgi:hemolysin III